MPLREPCEHVLCGHGFLTHARRSGLHTHNHTTRIVDQIVVVVSEPCRRAALGGSPLAPVNRAMLRPGMEVNVCGRWVADMHMLWNELHPLTSIRVLGNFVPASAWILAVSPMLDGED